MDQKKAGRFLKELRHEKQMTQEQLAQVFNVSSRSVSRWETGTNLPDISLLVEIADFYDVDVREIIEGERKSEMMDKEVRDVATKMADYANEEKGSLLRKMQIISFVGVLVLLVAIFLQTFHKSLDEINKGILFVSFIALVIMAILTLYVTGLLEKITKNKRLVKWIKFVTIVGVIAAFWRAIVMTFIVGILMLMVSSAKVEVYDDVSAYNDYMNFSNGAYEKGVDTQWTKWGMDETIWPKEISKEMNVTDFKMVYYNPWDAQYLGYMVVEYSEDAYAEEVKRLKEYESTEYIGYYCVEEEKTYELLAVNADPYQGFIYALTDGKGKIIYGEQIFCNYFMDLEYDKYIPKEYLLDGFNATQESEYYREKRKALEG
ncbi:helix-turn-helix domain-containing protein [Butyrivibrio sp. INlla21]|uniref:helix-turn-helix domain-containing protein n=1 Tax=Butyrivibrio sp. INlla21 TaxID=1520811 RepID=UPI0008ED2D93|nr:helix-turn-helix domain-containing protein [Butyrivibrio sp. INlla21]SFU88867.1 Transcriptional regulator, contains XRE-family HTH domain [Butyrivibrio sp. INlla21]